MNTDKIDPFETPVWALYGNRDGAEIIHGCFPRCNDKRPLSTRMHSEGGVWTSRSGWAETREELIEKNGILPACSECGSPFATKSWCDPYPKLLRKSNLCFHCYHYIHTTIPGYNQEGLVVISQTVYSYNPTRPVVKIDGSGQGYGHGGRMFCIRLKDGRSVQTNNLWRGGEIPARFASRLPDNATFESIPEPIGHGQGFLG